MLFLSPVTFARNILQFLPTQPDPTFLKSSLILVDVHAES